MYGRRGAFGFHCARPFCIVAYVLKGVEDCSRARTSGLSPAHSSAANVSYDCGNGGYLLVFSSSGRGNQAVQTGQEECVMRVKKSEDRHPQGIRFLAWLSFFVTRPGPPNARIVCQHKTCSRVIACFVPISFNVFPALEAHRLSNHNHPRASMYIIPIMFFRHFPDPSLRTISSHCPPRPLVYNNARKSTPPFHMNNNSIRPTERGRCVHHEQQQDLELHLELRKLQGWFRLVW